MANVVLSCHLETLLECSKQLQLECCIWIVNVPIILSYGDTTIVLQTLSIGVLSLGCKCSVILLYRVTPRVVQTPSIGVLYQCCKCPTILPYRDTTRVLQTP